MSDLRPELPAVTPRIARLPVHRGYPVPWFVAWLDEDGKALARGEGTPDFRVLQPGAITQAWNDHRCWICGDRTGSYVSFVVGPMCAVNRTSAEPPAHRDCAEWSTIACPFLSRPHMRRNEAGMPEDATAPAGIMLRRNPGVTLVWTTRRSSAKPRIAPAPGGGRGVLFYIGEPEEVVWIYEGRPATRAEVEESIRTGLPSLLELANAQGPAASAALERQLAVAVELLPAA